MAQPQSGPMLINIPPPGSNPDTPSEMPGTPTSTTTSLSALSTTAIKDGHRGHAAGLQPFGGRGHQHNPSTNSLEAERADRISRLAGLERVSTLRPGPSHSSANQQTTPTSTGFPQHGPLGGAPAYFDSNGQPTAANKRSTVGSASATGSTGGRTTTEGGDHSEMDVNTEVDDDFMSNPSNYRTMDVDSVAGAIDQDDYMTNRSVGGFEDRMSDDGTASLVGFGEGANSTVSGPIYQRRPLPGQAAAAAAGNAWGLERSSSGLSDGAHLRSRDLRDTGSSETPLSAAAAAERREVRYAEGAAMEGDSSSIRGGRHGVTNDDRYTDSTTQGPVPVLPGQPQTSALREGVGGPASRESAAERLIRERLDGGESDVGSSTIRSPRGEAKLGQFYFEK